MGEIGIDSRIEYQAVVKNELRVETSLTLRVYLIKTRLGWVARIDGAEVAERSVGNELHVVAGRDVLQAADRAFLVQDTGDTARHIWPVVDLVVMRDVAHESHPPGRAVAGMETQTAEGNRHPDNEPFCG